MKVPGFVEQLNTIFAAIGYEAIVYAHLEQIARLRCKFE
jgi:hypothetical protein